jgi:hypothetical protein
VEDGEVVVAKVLVFVEVVVGVVGLVITGLE